MANRTPPPLPHLIAWDFDGVLNRGYPGDFTAWQASFQADLGCSAAEFAEFVFAPGRFDAVLTGARDLLDLLSDWVAASAAPVSARLVLDYWLAKDAHLDGEVMGWLRAAAVPGVLATNNESRRVAYIWETMGLRDHLAKVFASGPLGVKKPDPGFYAAIEAWSGLAPSQILLIDDAEKNIAAAAARGWQVFHFTEESRSRLPQVLGLSP